MKKTIENLLTDPSARTAAASAKLAYSETEFTPWED